MQRIIKVFSYLLIWGCFETCFTQSVKTSNYNFPKQIGTINSKKLSEISGIAPSHKDPNILWMINDSGNSPDIYAVSVSGEIKASFRIKGIRNVDWEELSGFSYQSKSYLVICDVGDNEGVRSNRSLYFIEEPTFSDADALSIDWTIEYTYEDGSRDCESVAVDISRQRILLLSKRDKPPRLYEIPLFPIRENKKVIAKKIGELTSIPKISERDIRFNHHLQWGNQPTAMDISPVTNDLVILTYKTAYLYPYQSNFNTNWDFSQQPVALILPLLKQSESLCIGSNGHDIYVTSEKLPAPIIQLKKKESSHVRN